MLACIPTEGNAGRDDVVYGHFGSAPYFTLYNSDTDEIQVIENRNAEHEHGSCHPMKNLAKFKIDAVICAGMGMRAIYALNSEGIKIYSSESKPVSEVLEKIKAGLLVEMDPSRACPGHGQHTDPANQALGVGRMGHGGCAHRKNRE